MKSITFNDAKINEDITLAYSDYGSGQPVIFIHGWPSSREMWEYQIAAMVNGGYRVIKYDRRGFGKSSKPWTGYDYDTLAEDLKQLIDQLKLDKVILVGFSMGGGEIVRYIAKYGEDKLSKIVLVSSIIPYMLKTEDNPQGIDQKVFDGMAEDIREDRIAFLHEFGKNFFSVGFLNKPLSNQLLDYYQELTTKAPQHSTLACAHSFSTTDFREDVKKITVPTLLIHGDNDKIVPIENSSERTAQMMPHANLLVYSGAPHGLFYTHREELNTHLLEFFSGAELTVPFTDEAVPAIPLSTI